LPSARRLSSAFQNAAGRHASDHVLSCAGRHSRSRKPSPRGYGDAHSRITHLICELYLRLKAVGLTNGYGFEAPITQTEIGQATGLSTVHVNRSIQKLRSEGLITLEKARCTIGHSVGGDCRRDPQRTLQRNPTLPSRRYTHLHHGRSGRARVGHQFR
jgi:CRP-like cAMP-binding protein